MTSPVYGGSLEEVCTARLIGPSASFSHLGRAKRLTTCYFAGLAPSQRLDIKKPSSPGLKAASYKMVRAFKSLLTKLSLIVAEHSCLQLRLYSRIPRASCDLEVRAIESSYVVLVLHPVIACGRLRGLTLCEAKSSSAWNVTAIQC